MENFIVIYRPHNRLNCDTQYFGPYTDYLVAEDKLSALGALGVYEDDGVYSLPGVKFIQTLRA